MNVNRNLVTGSTAGIGFAIAPALAREGASVVITGRPQQRIDNAIESIRKEIRDAKISDMAVDMAAWTQSLERLAAYVKARKGGNSEQRKQ